MRICSITHHQLVNNPRICREADALANAGHDVRVVGVQQSPELRGVDEELASGKRWRMQRLFVEKSPRGIWNWFRTGVRKKWAKQLWRNGRRGEKLLGLAYTRTFRETIRQVVSEPTDLIIAHTQPMLAPAYFAARKIGCPWGFDFEDILSEEYGEGIDEFHHQALVRAVEAEFIPRASFVTAASGPFQNWIKQNLSKDSFLVRNVPSLADAPEHLVPGYPHTRKKLSLYWFSQSIGPLRGIEDMLQALRHLDVPAELHLRGEVLPSYREELFHLIRNLGVERSVIVHSRIAPQELIRDAACHDIGLALMQPCCLNHQNAVPNKIYAYMMAGLAVAATRTEGHLSVMREAEGVGFTYEPGDYLKLAGEINFLAKNPETLLQFRRRAFELARSQFNWESEQTKIVQLVESLDEKCNHCCA